MKDTAPAIERKFRQMLLNRSGEERLKMGCSMHATARALAKAALLQKHPGARPAELKRLLFLHFYGADFEPDERNQIALALSRSGRPYEAQRVGKPTTHKRSGLVNLANTNSDTIRKKGESYGKKVRKKDRRLRSSR